MEMTFEQAIIAERVVTDRVNATFELVMVKDKWVIDAWKYG